MRRFLPVFLSCILAFSVVFQPKQASANAALKIVAGSVAENVMVGIAEKAGIKYGSMTAREKAMMRWNWDWKELDKITDEEMRQRLADFETQIKKKPTPIPEKPGYGRVLLSTAAFLTGVDLIYNAYQAFQRGKQTGEMIELLAEHNYLVQEGERIIFLPGVSLVYGEPYFGNPKNIGVTMTINGVPYERFRMDIAKDYPFIYWFGQSVNVWYIEYIRKFWNDYDSLVTREGYVDLVGYVMPAEPFEVGFTPSDVHIPSVNIPEVLRPYVDGNPQTLPESIPNATIEVVVPIDAPYPIGKTVNEPIKATELNPDSNPSPEPGTESEPGTEPSPKPTNPFGIPVAAIDSILCMLKAIIMYVLRLFQFVIAIPTVAPTPFGNAAFEWFRTAKIMGVQVYNVVSSLAAVGLSLMVFKIIRRVLP